MPTVIGPSEPPIMVVMPELMACSQSWASRNAHARRCRPASQSCLRRRALFVAAPTIRFGCTPSMFAGSPALPTPTIFPSLMPISPLTMPSTGSITRALHRSISSAPWRCHSRVIAPNPRESLAAAMQALFAGNGEVMLDLGEERGVAEADRIAHRRAIHMRVVFAAHLGHRLMLP